MSSASHDATSTALTPNVLVASENVIRRWFSPTSDTLFSPAADVFMAGGASILFFIFLVTFLPKNAALGPWATAVYWAAFLVNYPHFASSYQLLYGDGREGFRRFREDPWLAMRLWWVGLIVPIILVLYFVYALMAHSAPLMGYLGSAMFFFVGWHYVKQIYGCFIVLSSAKKVYYAPIERRVVLSALYSLWAFSFIAVNQNGGVQVFYQIPYPIAHIPTYFLTASEVLFFIFSSLAFVLLAAKFYRSKQRPPFSAQTALIAIVLWWFPFWIIDPSYNNQYFFYIVPLFHSLQYLLFVLAYERNKSVREIDGIKERMLERDMPTLSGLTRGGLVIFIAIPFVLIAGLFFTKYGTNFEILMGRWFGANVATSTLISMLLVVVGVAFSFGLALRRSETNAYARFGLFFMLAVVAGLLGFSLIPDALDILARKSLLPSFLSYDTTLFGGTLYLFFFSIFINIHHYFIDNVIWRRTNPYIREYLFVK